MFDTLSEKFERAFKSLRGQGKLTPSNIREALAQVKTALLEADVNFKVVKSFVAQVEEKSLGEKVLLGVDPHQQFIKIVQDELTEVMGKAHGEFPPNRPGPLPVLIVGLNGAGKTTLTGKLSRWLIKQNQEVLVVPADTFRPAAKDQLQALCLRVGVDCFDSDLSSHPQEIVKKAMVMAEERHKKVVLIDTAGRLQGDEKLMGELREVKESMTPWNPEVLLVADAMTGQEAVNVAESFHRTLGLTGVVLSKMDGDARGGAALSIRSVTGVPIRFISLGEKMEDLELFHPDRLASRILDMGDVVSLVEKAEQAIDEKEAQRMMENLEKNRFTINDLMKQMEGLSKMGPMGELLKMIPGMGGMVREMGDLGLAEKEMKKMKVVVNSMTPQERENDKILNKSRLRRIARGAGTSLQEVKGFLDKFKQMERMMSGMMKMMKKGGGGVPMGIPGLPGGEAPGLGRGERPKKKKKGNGKFGKGYFW